MIFVVSQSNKFVSYWILLFTTRRASKNAAQGLTMRHQLSLHYVDTVARVGSIRKAADQLAITSSALNRRIISMEEDLGVPIFDRVPNGVRLNSAGEILVQHFRSQLAEMDRVKSQINDLQGERRGHVSIVCSQAPMVSLLPAEVEKYRSLHPAVTFSINVCNRQTAIVDLQSFNADIAVVFEPEASADFQTVCSVPQQLHAQFNASHPLAQKKTLRLRDCLEWPLALTSRNNGIRHLLENAAIRLSTPMQVAIESDNLYLLRQILSDTELVSFTLPSGILKDDSLAHRPVDSKDIPVGTLHFGQLKGRHLSVAAAKFLEQLSNSVIS